jgi:hypothetical protein
LSDHAAGHRASSDAPDTYYFDTGVNAARPQIFARGVTPTGAHYADGVTAPDEPGRNFMKITPRRSGVRRIELVEEEEAQWCTLS